VIADSAVVSSTLDSQAARDFLRESAIRPQSIAPLPRVCAQLAELTAQQVTDAAQLARLIQSDPALAGEIMRVANSPALRPRMPVVSLQQAVSWLGVAEVRNIAMAVMLRSVGIPSRVVNGFSGGEFNDITSEYVIRASDAHSWVEAYLPGEDWVEFDPTPAGGGERPDPGDRGRRPPHRLPRRAR